MSICRHGNLPPCLQCYEAEVRRRSAKIDEDLIDAFRYGTSRFDFGTAPKVEVITDPTDLRGFDAKLARVAA